MKYQPTPERSIDHRSMILSGDSHYYCIRKRNYFTSSGSTIIIKRKSNISYYDRSRTSSISDLFLFIIIVEPEDPPKIAVDILEKYKFRSIILSKDNLS